MTTGRQVPRAELVRNNAGGNSLQVSASDMEKIRANEAGLTVGFTAEVHPSRTVIQNVSVTQEIPGLPI